MAGEPLITVVGNLVADPEPRVSQAGKSWVTFRIASTPRVRDRQSGDWSDGEPLWLGCRAYGEYADNIAASLTKGMRVIVQGRLTQRSYTDNQGQQRTSLDLEVEEIGPSLRFATAQVNRGQSRGQVGGFGGGSGQPQGQSSWGRSGGNSGGGQGGQQDNPWTNSGQGNSGGGFGGNSGGNDFGGGFDDEQPF
ncbi:MAG: single-stranded DNA-binding protein [Leucobacter sp.]